MSRPRQIALAVLLMLTASAIALALLESALGALSPAAAEWGHPPGAAPASWRRALAAALPYGVVFGLALGLAAQLGGRRRRPASSLVRVVAFVWVLALMAALVGGAAGYQLARAKQVEVPEVLRDRLTPRERAAFVAAGLARLSGQFVAATAGGAAVAAVAFSRRRRLNSQQVPQRKSEGKS